MTWKKPFLFICSFLIFSCSTGARSVLCSITPCVAAGEVSDTSGFTSKPAMDGEGRKEDFFSDYIIGPEDVVEISVWKNDALSKVVTVRPDGKISLPLIGDVQAASLTASQLKEAITEKLREFKETPGVSVIVRETNSYMVYIIGEVVRPGKYPLKSRTTLLQGITLAGGFTPYASKNSIILLRRSSSGENRMQFKYDDIVSGKKGTVDPLLFPGDTVVIP